MHIRKSHVTNSSSSSFIIAYRRPKLDKEIIDKNPFLKRYFDLLNKVLLSKSEHYETTAGESFESKEEFDEWILDCWGDRNETIDDILREDSYVMNFYYPAIEYLNKGYKILNKNVDYSDKFLYDLINDFAKNNEDFIILDRD